jgi:hypothetical protein
MKGISFHEKAFYFCICVSTVFNSEESFRNKTGPPGFLDHGSYHGRERQGRLALPFNHNTSSSRINTNSDNEQYSVGEKA